MEKGAGEISYVNSELTRRRSHKISLDPQTINKIGQERVDLDRLYNFAEAINNATAHPSEVMVVGGVALRLLEAIVGTRKEGEIFSSNDIDLVYFGSDEKRRKNIQAELEKHLTQRVDLQRMAAHGEEKSSLFPQMILTKGGDFLISALKGTVKKKMPQEHFELIEVEVKGKSLYVASPAMLYHFYATRSLGGGKRKDWLKNKFHRIRDVRKQMIRTFGLNLLSPLELSEWRDFRREIRRSPIAKALHFGVDVHDTLGRPLEKIGLATKIR